MLLDIVPAPEDVADDEDPGFAGTGLLVGEDGALALAIMDGGLEDIQVFRITEAEATCLALMIRAVLG